MNQSTINHLFHHFPVNMVITHAAKAKQFVLKKLEDDKQIHDLMWFLLEGDYSEKKLAGLLGITQSELNERMKRLTERVESCLKEYGIELEYARSMRSPFSFFGRVRSHISANY